MVFRSFLVMLASIVLLTSGVQKKLKYVYNEDTEGYVIQTTWIVELEPNGLRIDGDNPEGITKIDCSSEYTINKFAYKAKDSDREFVIERNGSQLVAKGKIKSKDRMKTHDIGDTPWIQEFGFGLRAFMASEETSYKFCIVNPKDFGVVKMIAKKKKIETIEVGDKEYSAQKVYVTLQGLKSMFWGADMWFDAKSQDLLMYEADQGPDTPFTVITFENKANL